MTQYLYRLTKPIYDEMSQTNTIPIDFLPPDCANAQNGDEVIVYVAESLSILGMYTLTNLKLTLVEKFEQVTLRDIWNHFDCVHTITPNTSRLFKKKMRELTQIEYGSVLSQLQESK